MTYTVSPEGIVALLGHEGVVPAPYYDSKGVLTWGVGHTAAAGAPIPANMPRGMPKDIDATLDEVFTVFAADLKSYSAAVNKALKVKVSQHEFDALVSFHFNTGAIARAEVTRLLNLGDRAGAAKAFMNWKTPTEIIERREDEKHLFEKGVYPDNLINVWHVNDAGKIIWKQAKKIKPEEALAMMGSHWTPKIIPNFEEPEDEGLPETDAITGTPLLGIGSKGLEVSFLQTLLNKHGIETLIDGKFGNGTKKSVLAFQKAKKLKQDAKVGPKTWEALQTGIA